MVGRQSQLTEAGNTERQERDRESEAVLQTVYISLSAISDGISRFSNNNNKTENNIPHPPHKHKNTLDLLGIENSVLRVWTSMNITVSHPP